MSGDAAAAEEAPSDEGGLGTPGEKPEWLSLDEDEELRWVGQPATASLASAFIWGIVLTPLLGLGLLIIAASLVSVFNTDYVVTNKSLYHKSGVLSTNIESVGLDRIQNTEYSQSFMGKQFGYGTIEISTAGSSGADLSFRSIENPRDVRDLVNRLSNTVGGTAGDAAGESEGASAGVEEELLEELLYELQGVNDAMANVERLLREEAGEPRSTADRTASGGTGAGAGGGSGGAPAASDAPASGGSAAASGDAEGEDGHAATASEFVSGSASDDGGDASATDGTGEEAAGDDEDDPPPTPFGGDDG